MRRILAFSTIFFAIFFEIGGRVHVDAADAFEMREDGNARRCTRPTRLVPRGTTTSIMPVSTA